MEGNKFGSFDDLLALAEKSLHPIMAKLRAVVLEIDPKACEVVRLGDRAITFGVGPKKMTEGYAYVLPYKSWVNIGFYKGVQLDDETNILEGTGKNMRHVKIRTLEEAAHPALKKLITLAVEERKKALDKE